MQMETADEVIRIRGKLKQYAVQFFSGDKPRGSGFLYVPKGAMDTAYILTAAHVLSVSDSYKLAGDENGTRQYITEKMISEEYDNSRIDEYQREDAAVVPIKMESWMRTMDPVYFGEMQDSIKIQAVGASKKSNPEIEHNLVPHAPVAATYTPNSGKVSFTLDANLIIDTTDPVDDIKGMSGTVFSDVSQADVVIVCIMTGADEDHGTVYAADLQEIQRLLKKQRVPVARKEVLHEAADVVPERPRRVGKILLKMLMIVLIPALLVGIYIGNQRYWEAEGVRLKQLKEMPDALMEYAVFINNRKVSVPTTFHTLERMGWACVPGENMEDRLVEPNTYGGKLLENGEYESYEVTMTNGHGRLDVTYGNPTNHRLNAKECIIYSIRFYSYIADDSYTGDTVNTVEGPLGLVLGQSKWTDLEWPKGYSKRDTGSHRGGSNFVTYTYIKKADYDYAYQYRFDFNKNTGELEILTITNRDTDAMGALVGAYNTQLPEIKPEDFARWLGIKMELSVGEYTFPIGVPVSEYCELGYTLDKSPEFIVGGGEDVAYFSCDPLTQVECVVYNPFPEALAIEHCYIIQLGSCDVYSYEEDFVLCLSNGSTTISLYKGMELETLDSLLETVGSMCYIGGEGGSIFGFPGNNAGISVSCEFTPDKPNRLHKIWWVTVKQALDEYLAHADTKK